MRLRDLEQRINELKEEIFRSKARLSLLAESVLQILIDLLGLRGGPWDAIAGLEVGHLGFIIVGTFALAWIVAFAVFKLWRVEERWGALIEGGGAA